MEELEQKLRLALNRIVRAKQPARARLAVQVKQQRICRL